MGLVAYACVPLVAILLIVVGAVWSATCFAAEMPENEEIFGWITDLCRRAHRRPGTEFGLEAERYILEKLESFGLAQCRLEPIEMTIWTADRWDLTVITSDGEERIPCFFIPNTKLTSPEGVEAELVYIGEGISKQDACRNVKGRIVVADVRFGTVPLQAIRAAAYLTYDHGNTIAQGGDKLGTWLRTNWDVTYGLADREGATGFIGILADIVTALDGASTL